MYISEDMKFNDDDIDFEDIVDIHRYDLKDDEDDNAIIKEELSKPKEELWEKSLTEMFEPKEYDDDDTLKEEEEKESMTIEDQFKFIMQDHNDERDVFDESGYFLDDIYNKYAKEVADEFYYGDIDALDKACAKEHCFLEDDIPEVDSETIFKEAFDRVREELFEKCEEVLGDDCELVSDSQIYFDDSARNHVLYVDGALLNLPVSKFGAWRDYLGGGALSEVKHNGRTQDGTVELGKLFAKKLEELDSLLMEMELEEGMHEEEHKEEEKCEEKECESKCEEKKCEDLSQDLGEYQKWVDYDMKKYGEVSAITMNKLRQAGLTIVKDDHGEWEVIAKKEDTDDVKEECKLDERITSKDNLGGFDYNGGHYLFFGRKEETRNHYEYVTIMKNHGDLSVGKYRWINRPWQRFDYASALIQAVISWDESLDKVIRDIVNNSYDAKEAIEKLGKHLNGEKEEVKEDVLKEEPVYDLSPRYDSRKSFYGKARVEELKDGTQILWSYSTPVCMIKDGKVTLLYGWATSQTTLRHVRDFLKQNGFEAGSKASLGKMYPVKEYDELKKDLAESTECKESKKLKEGLKIICDFDDYSPWSDAVDTYDKIYNADKMEELEALLEDEFPEGATMADINDMLWHDSEYVLSALGIADEDEEIDVEDEVEVEESKK